MELVKNHISEYLISCQIVFAIDFIPTHNDFNKSLTHLAVSVNAGLGATHGA